MLQGPNTECESTGPLWARRWAGKGPGPGRPPCRRTSRPLGAALGWWSERERLRAIRCEGRGSLRAMRGRGRDIRRRTRWEPTQRSRLWSRRPGPITERGEGGASKPGGKDGAAVEVTAEVGASKPITAGGVAGRAGCGPGRASVPITAGTRGPGRGTRCAVCRRAGPRIPARRGERREPHAHCAPG